jgi:hypothetical protein
LEVTKGFETLTALVAKLAAQPANNGVASNAGTNGENGKAPEKQTPAAGGKFNPQGVEKADVAGAELAKALDNGVRLDTVRK